MSLLSFTHQLFKEKKQNSTLLHPAFDHMLEGIQIHDFNWRYIYVNDALVNYSHYQKEELLGYTLMEKYPGIENTALFKVLKRCMNERINEHFETEFAFPDGSKADFELSIQPVPEGLFILSINRTEHKKAEREIRFLNENLEQKVKERTRELESTIIELKESEEKFAKVFQASAAGIAITDLSDSNYMDVNCAFIQMTGFSKEELIGHNSQELGMTTNITKREEVLNEIRERGSAKDFEMTIRHKSGRIFEILASVETIILKGKKCALNVIYDITDRKRAEEQLASVNKELEAFTYTVSHDLRAPLRAINGYAEILREDYGPGFDEEGNRILHNITYGAVKMGNLIDDLLAFSKLGRQEIKTESIDLNELVEAIIQEVNKNPDHKTKIIVTTMQRVKADYSLLYQVIFNLVSNGIKYSAKKANPLVEISAVEQNGEIVFSVKDNGSGFDMKYADKLFGVFQRLHSQDEFEGTGVGLAIVQRIITKHNGKVWAEGKINEGATFYFSLPII
jgi:PAS domain S-box-containing protein